MTVLRKLTTYAAIVGLLASFVPASAAEPNDPQHKRGNPPAGKAPPAAQQRGGGAPPSQPRPQPQPQVRINPAPVARAPSPQQVYRPAPSQPPRYEARGRDNRDYNDGRRRDRNRYIGAGVAAVIIGSSLGYRYYRGPSRDSIYDRCDNNFPDFEYDTGTFINEDGDRELCPYLRPYVD
jgi:hypothetical protein